jgi:predicted nucleotidyltransferase
MEQIAIPAKEKEELAALGVVVLYLYGSRAIGSALERSDFDIGVVFSNPRIADGLTAYTALYDVLSDIFPDTVDGPKLDIALLQGANAALQMNAIQYGIVLFESDPRDRADYEESVVKQYDDYRFLQKEYEDANFRAFRNADKAYV